MRYASRRSAGAELGAALVGIAPHDPVVLGLPRGGVPVAYEVARALECPLDVLVVRKIGVPWQPELAMGSVGEGGVVVKNQEVIDGARVDEGDFQRVLAEESRVLTERVERYRATVDPVELKDHTVIVVDDGLATGSTARAAIAVLRERGLDAVWLAVPVAPRDTIEDMDRLADRVVTLQAPTSFGAVGAWYEDFSQTGDEEVTAMLGRSRLR